MVLLTSPESKWSIVDIYNEIQNSEMRNNLIIQDVIAAISEKRNPIILTERTEHVKYLAARLSESVKNVFALIGGESQKKSREKLQLIADIPVGDSLVIVATGKYVGEGFDLPRLDTLFLAMPISWKGTLQQYAGRLHRLYEEKKEVQVYDYVDIHVPMLEKMYQRRLKGYAAIGYKAKGTPQTFDKIHSIFDNRTFFPLYSADILAAQSEVLIVTPFSSIRRITSALSYLMATKAEVTVVTKPIDNYSEKDRDRVAECISILSQEGIAVKTKDRIHQKYAIVDQRIVWYGSINFLSYGNSEESVMRIENLEVAGELLGMV